MDTNSTFLKRWIKWDRVIPAFTILGGGLVVTLSILGVMQTTFAESVIITLLILLAADTLSERIGILEDLRERIGSISAKISILEDLRKRVDSISAKSGLRTRDDIELKSRIENARKVSVLAVSAFNLLNDNISLFYDFIRKPNTHLRFLLVDPNCPALTHYHELDTEFDPPPEVNINRTLDMIKQLQSKAGEGSICEVKLLRCIVPFSLIMIERQEITDIMWVEFHNYRVHYGKRPNIMLRLGDESTWFNFYANQFEAAWQDGR